MADTTTPPAPPPSGHAASPAAPVQPGTQPLARPLRVGRIARGSEEAERLRQIWDVIANQLKERPISTTQAPGSSPIPFAEAAE